MPIVVYSSDTRTYRRVGWPFALWGAALVIFGLVISLEPRLTANLVVTLFGWVSLIGGGMQIASAFIAKKAFHGITWIPILVGCIAIALGAFTLVWPEVIASAFALIVGAAIMAWGGTDAVIGWTGRKYLITWQLHVVRGLLIATFGIIIMTRPLEAIIGISWLLGLFAVMVGTMTILMGIMARR